MEVVANSINFWTTTTNLTENQHPAMNDFYSKFCAKITYMRYLPKNKSKISTIARSAVLRIYDGPHLWLRV